MSADLCWTTRHAVTCMQEGRVSGSSGVDEQGMNFDSHGPIGVDTHVPALPDDVRHRGQQPTPRRHETLLLVGRQFEDILRARGVK